MTKDETIERLCALVITVGEEVFYNRLIADCFCWRQDERTWGPAHVDEDVVAYIEDAVNKAIADTKAKLHEPH